MDKKNKYNKDYTTGFSKSVAWRRFTARILDMAFYPVFFFFMLGLICRLTENEKLLTFIDFITIDETSTSQAKTVSNYLMGLFTCLVLIPISYKIFGTTLGKMLMGINIKVNGNKLGYFESTWREGEVYLIGLSLGAITFIYQYFQLKKNNCSSWDLGLEVYYIKYSLINLFIRYCITISLIISLIHVMVN